MSKRIVLTGGGTAGHVTPNLALIPGLKERGFEILYVGSESGMEKDLVEKEGIAYIGVPAGKFRRNFDLKNVTDIQKVFRGLREAKQILRDFQPDVVFSKGGYVSVPVVRAAGALKIPVVIHESDMTPGLANKLCYGVASKICCNFPETLPYLPHNKGICTGSPIRRELLLGDKENGYRFTGMSPDKPILLMIGGSLGARALNIILRDSLDELLPDFQIVHLCGRGNYDESLENIPGYRQYEYISAELKDLFAIADIAFSRAGANAICELLALHKPALLVPLTKAASRGDQILNAASFEKQGFSMVCAQENLTKEVFIEKIHTLYENRKQYETVMQNSSLANGVEEVLKLIDEAIVEDN